MAEPGSISVLNVSNYINRAEGVDKQARLAAERASAYINRSDDYNLDDNDELGAHVLLDRGLGVSSGAALARKLDNAERKADRSYRQYGGRLPRVGSHLNASLPWGVTDELAGEILLRFATAISERLEITVEGRVHNKHDRPDHIHLLLGTRVVRHGRIGRKCRSLDAVSEKAAGRGIRIGTDRRLARHASGCGNCGQI